MITPEDVDHILETVGKPSRSKIDRSDLLIDLDYIDTYLEVAATQTSSNKKNRQRKFAIIAKTARRLKMLTTEIDVLCSAAPSIDLIIEKTDAEIRDNSNKRPQSSLSPLEWIVGDYLPSIFTKHFGQRATKALNGRFVRFAEAALAMSDIKYARASIVRALSRADRQRVGKTESKTQNRPSMPSQRRPP